MELNSILHSLLDKARENGESQINLIDTDYTGYSFSIRRLDEQPVFLGETAYVSSTPDSILSELLLRIGMLPHLKGYRYIKTAVLLCLENPVLLHSITAELYPAVARTFSTSPNGVQRAIRKSIDTICDNGTLTNSDEFTARFKHGIPTNGELIALLTERMQKVL